MDIGIVFSSHEDRSLGPDVEKELAKKIAEKHHISGNAALIGAIVYGKDAKLAWKLGDVIDLPSTISKIDLLKRPQDGNNLKKSLHLARDELFITANGARPDAAKTLILFVSETDGKDQQIEDAAKELKERGTNVIVVSTGNKTNEKHLAGIASNAAKLILPRDLLGKLDNVSQSVLSQSLPGNLNAILKNLISHHLH